MLELHKQYVQVENMSTAVNTCCFELSSTATYSCSYHYSQLRHSTYMYQMSQWPHEGRSAGAVPKVAKR